MWLGQVIVRNLDDRVIARLKERAQAHGRSLEGELREIISEAARPRRPELLAELDRIRAMTPPGPPTDTTKIIREARDRGWRST